MRFGNLILIFVYHYFLIHPGSLAQGQQKKSSFEQWSAPNFGVKLRMSLRIDAVSDLNTKEMEFSVRLNMIEQATLNNLTCKVYMRGLPKFLGISAPQRNQTVFVPSNTRHQPPPWKPPPYYFPEIFFKEARSDVFISRTNLPFATRYTNVLRNGVDNCDPLYMTKRKLTIACSLEFKDFPLDRQICRLTLMSFTYSRKEVDLTWDDKDGLVINDGIRLTESSLEIKKIIKCDDEYVNPDAPSATICVEFLFERNLTYQLINTFLPSFLLVVASLGVFLMKPQSANERITLSITTLLALFIIYGRTRQALPPSGSLTYADIWLIGCLFSVLVVVMECCVVEQIGYSETELGERKRNQQVNNRRKYDLHRYLQEIESRLPQKMKPHDGITANEPSPSAMSGKSDELKKPQESTHPAPERKPGAAVSLLDKVRHPPRPRLSTERIDLWAGVVCVGGFTVFTLAFWITVVKKSFVDKS